MPTPALLTVREVADKLGISTFRVYRRIRRNDLRAVPMRQGHFRFLVRADDLQAYIDAGGPHALTAPKPTQWITTGEAARRTGLSMETIRHLCYAGRLEFIQGGGKNGRLHVSARAVDELLP